MLKDGCSSGCVPCPLQTTCRARNQAMHKPGRERCQERNTPPVCSTQRGHTTNPTFCVLSCCVLSILQAKPTPTPTSPPSCPAPGTIRKRHDGCSVDLPADGFGRLFSVSSPLCR
ncbi:unnamed protein product, partial [Ectocarpus sp. 12 AP-2014]